MFDDEKEECEKEMSQQILSINNITIQYILTQRDNSFLWNHTLWEAESIRNSKTTEQLARDLILIKGPTIGH